MSSVFRVMAESGVDVPGLKSQIENIIRLTVISIQPLLATNYRTAIPWHDGKSRCFEVLGFDILIDKKAIPWLLEVNWAPSLASGSPFDIAIKSSVVKGALNIVNINPNFKRIVNNRRRSLSQARDTPQVFNINEELERAKTTNYHLIYPLEESHPLFEQTELALTESKTSTVGAGVTPARARAKREALAAQYQESLPKPKEQVIVKQKEPFVVKPREVREHMTPRDAHVVKPKDQIGLTPRDHVVVKPKEQIGLTPREAVVAKPSEQEIVTPSEPVVPQEHVVLTADEAVVAKPKEQDVGAAIDPVIVPSKEEVAMPPAEPVVVKQEIVTPREPVTTKQGIAAPRGAVVLKPKERGNMTARETCVGRQKEVKEPVSDPVVLKPKEALARAVAQLKVIIPKSRPPRPFPTSRVIQPKNVVPCVLPAEPFSPLMSFADIQGIPIDPREERERIQNLRRQLCASQLLGLAPRVARIVNGGIESRTQGAVLPLQLHLPMGHVKLSQPCHIV
jgi:hypothetical protein